jgi:hypothetical protein
MAKKHDLSAVAVERKICATPTASPFKAKDVF